MWTKYIVRVAVSNKPIAVFSSLAAAQDFCKLHCKKKLYITEHIIE